MLFSAIKVLLLNIVLALATLIPQSTLSIGMIGQPSSFLPHDAKSDSEKLISQLIFKGLFKYQDGELKTDLLSDWNVSDDLITYTFKIKADAKWQDGTPISSNDIIYTLSLYEKIINEMEIEKTGEKEVQIKLSTPTSMLPSILTLGIEPAHLPNQSKIQPTGSTSYRILFIQKERDSIQKVIIQSFSGNKQYNRVSISFYKNENDQQTAYKLAEISSFLSNSDITLPGANKISITYLGRYFVLLFNTEQPALSLTENRKVLESALDIETQLKKHYYENTIISKGPVSETFASKGALFKSAYNPNAKLTTSQSSAMTKLEIILPNNNDGRQIESLLRDSCPINKTSYSPFFPFCTISSRSKNSISRSISNLSSHESLSSDSICLPSLLLGSIISNFVIADDCEVVSFAFGLYADLNKAPLLANVSLTGPFEIIVFS